MAKVLRLVVAGGCLAAAGARGGQGCTLPDLALELGELDLL